MGIFTWPVGSSISKSPAHSPSKSTSRPHQRPSRSRSSVCRVTSKCLKITRSSDMTRLSHSPTTLHTQSVKSKPGSTFTKHIPMVTRPNTPHSSSIRAHKSIANPDTRFPDPTESLVLFTPPEPAITLTLPSDIAFQTDPKTSISIPSSLISQDTLASAVSSLGPATPIPSHSMQPLPTPGIPITEKDQAEAEQGNSTIAITVGCTLGGIVLIMLALYFCMHWRKCNRDSKKSERNDTSRDIEMQDPGGWSKEGSIRSKETSSDNASLMTFDPQERLNVANAVSWADRGPTPPKPQAHTQSAAQQGFQIRRKPVNITSRPATGTQIQMELTAQADKALPSLHLPARETPNDDNEHHPREKHKQNVRPQSRSVSPMGAFDPNQPHATHEEYAKVSPPASPKSAHRRLWPGQKHWKGFQCGGFDGRRVWDLEIVDDTP